MVHYVAVHHFSSCATATVDDDLNQIPEIISHAFPPHKTYLLAQTISVVSFNKIAESAVNWEYAQRNTLILFCHQRNGCRTTSVDIFNYQENNF